MGRKICSFVLIIFLVMGITGCGIKKQSRYEAEFLFLFDTFSKVIGYTESENEFKEMSQLIYDNLKEYHMLYDIYNEYEGLNNIKTINDNAGIAPVRVDKRIIDLIRFGKEWHDKTGGRLNIAYGTVLKIWHEYRTAGTKDPENAMLPPEHQLRIAAAHTNIRDIIIDDEKSTVFLSDPEMSLDVGSIGKGYAVEQVCRIAMEKGLESGLVSVGGNVRAVGNKTGRKRNEEKPWNVGIQNPFKEPDKSDIMTVDMTDTSLVTSGVYERYYTVDDKDYHHIIDPETMFPSDYFVSVSIICYDSGLADALSTGVFNMPFEEGLDLIESMPSTEALWVFKDGEIRESPGFHLYRSPK